jgi:hypothetical protein
MMNNPRRSSSRGSSSRRGNPWRSNPWRRNPWSRSPWRSNSGSTKGGVVGCTGGVGGLKVNFCCSLSKSPNIFSTLLGSLKRGMKELVSACFSFPNPFFFLSFELFFSGSSNVMK